MLRLSVDGTGFLSWQQLALHNNMAAMLASWMAAARCGANWCVSTLHPGRALGPIASPIAHAIGVATGGRWQPTATAITWVLVAVVAVLALRRALKPKHRRGYGSGENSRWNRNIRVDRPTHQSKHHKLEHAWVYTGAHLYAGRTKLRQYLSYVAARISRTLPSDDKHNLLAV